MEPIFTPSQCTVHKLDQNLKFPHILTKFGLHVQYNPGFNLGPTHWTVPKLDQNLTIPHNGTRFGLAVHYHP